MLLQRTLLPPGAPGLVLVEVLVIACQLYTAVCRACVRGVAEPGKPETETKNSRGQVVKVFGAVSVSCRSMAPSP